MSSSDPEKRRFFKRCRDLMESFSLSVLEEEYDDFTELASKSLRGAHLEPVLEDPYRHS